MLPSGDTTWYLIHMMPKVSADEGIVYPFIYRFFTYLGNISPLTIIGLIIKRFNKKWEPSSLFVDLYVLFWFFIVGWGSVFTLHSMWSVSNQQNYPVLLSVIFVLLLLWRLIDILQRWWHVLFVPPLNAKAPRIIILVLINYLEVVIVFGVIGFLGKISPYYNPPSEIQVWDGLRASVGILTPLGIPNVPSTWHTGILFYVEYIIGLIFLVVVINLALSQIKNLPKKMKPRKN